MRLLAWNNGDHGWSAWHMYPIVAGREFSGDKPKRTRCWIEVPEKGRFTYTTSAVEPDTICKKCRDIAEVPPEPLRLT